MNGSILLTTTTSQSSELFRLSEYSVAASFSIVVWDAFLTIGDEVTYIWPKPRGAYLKWLYLFAKYFALALQTGIFNFHANFLAYHPIPALWCGVYRGLQVGGSQLLMITFDMVLLLRVYALHERKTPAMLLGAFAVLVEFATAVAGNCLVIPVILYDSACLVIGFPKNVIILVVGTLVSQLTLLWLAYRKKARVVRAERGLRRTSVASITIRDGVIAFVCIAALCVVLLGSQLANSSVMNMVLFWFPVFISIATCRLIMNPHRVSHTEVTTQRLSTDIWRPDYEMQTQSSQTPP